MSEEEENEGKGVTRSDRLDAQQCSKVYADILDFTMLKRHKKSSSQDKPSKKKARGKFAESEGDDDADDESSYDGERSTSTSSSDDEKKKNEECMIEVSMVFYVFKERTWILLNVPVLLSCLQESVLVLEALKVGVPVPKTKNLVISIHQKRQHELMMSKLRRC